MKIGHSDMNIGIFEIQSHVNCLSHMARICNTSEDTVTLFTNETVLSLADFDPQTNSDFEVDLQGERTLQEYLTDIENVSEESLDLLVINSMLGDTKRMQTYSEFEPQCASLLRLHSINLWFEEHLSELNGKAGKLNLLLRQRALDNHDGVFVAHEPLLEYLRTETPYDEKSYCFLPVFHEYTDADPSRSEDDRTGTTFVVPGRVDPYRKDFHVALDAYEAVAGDCDVGLHLLGHVRDEEARNIVQRCERLADCFDERVAFPDMDLDWISESEFIRVMQEADAVLSPVNESYEKRFMDETYGKTKTTGNVRDAVRFGMPLVVPTHFRLSDPLAGLTTQYRDTTELAAVMERFATDPDFRSEIQFEARETAEAFSLDRQRDRWRSIRNELTAPRPE